MSDIVERLRHKSAVVPTDNMLCDEAADEIERLRGLAVQMTGSTDATVRAWGRKLLDGAAHQPLTAPDNDPAASNGRLRMIAEAGEAARKRLEQADQPPPVATAEQAVGAVAALIRTLKGGERTGAVLALAAIGHMMEGTRASPQPDAARPVACVHVTEDEIELEQLGTLENGQLLYAAPQPSPVAYGCTGCQSAPCVCNDVLRNVLAEAEAELAFARSSGDESAIEYRALRERLAAAEAVAAADGTLHGAIDHWQERAKTAEARLAEAERFLRQQVTDTCPSDWGAQVASFLAPDSAASQPTATLEAMVTYHGGDARQRFRQRKCDPLPIWAQDVRDETADNGNAG